MVTWYPAVKVTADGKPVFTYINYLMDSSKVGVTALTLYDTMTV